MIDKKIYWLNFLLVLVVPLGMLGFGIGVYFIANWIEFKSFFVEFLVLWFPIIFFYVLIIAYGIKCILNFLFDEKKPIQNNTEEYQNGTNKPNGTEPKQTNSGNPNNQE